MTSRTHRRERDGVIMESNRKTPFIYYFYQFLDKNHLIAALLAGEGRSKMVGVSIMNLNDAVERSLY